MTESPFQAKFVEEPQLVGVAHRASASRGPQRLSAPHRAPKLWTQVDKNRPGHILRDIANALVSAETVSHQRHAVHEGSRAGSTSSTEASGSGGQEADQEHLGAVANELVNAAETASSAGITVAQPAASRPLASAQAAVSVKLLCNRRPIINIIQFN